ncbi:hypothetical protein HQ585_19235 [candidate division KSB1 bacterium]|nr:hypothetical protein [candidate division KSB1 bacterium]
MGVIHKYIIPISLFFCLNAGAQNLEEIINLHIEARGGLEVIRSVQTVRMIGRNQLYELDWTMMPVEISISRRGQIRIDNYWFEAFIVQYCDSSQAIWKDPNTERFEKMIPFQEEKVREMADLDGYFIDSESKGLSVELMGKGTCDNHQFWKIRLSHAKFERIVFINTETYLISKEIEFRQIQGVQTKMEKVYRDYRSISELVLPFEIETRLNGHSNSHFVFCDIQINPEFVDSLFDRKHSPLPK